MRSLLHNELDLVSGCSCSCFYDVCYTTWIGGYYVCTTEYPDVLTVADCRSAADASVAYYEGLYGYNCTLQPTCDLPGIVTSGGSKSFGIGAVFHVLSFFL